MPNNQDNQNTRENRNVQINQNSPEILTNSIYTPAFLREQIGKLMRVEFLIGTNNLVDVYKRQAYFHEVEVELLK